MTNSITNKTTVIRLYKGTHSQASKAYIADSVRMNRQGYEATGQVWSGGSYGLGAFLLALVLCLVIVGIIIFVYMLVVPPPGTLTVTYTQMESVVTEKTCPVCAENVKEAATICRYCRYEFPITKQANIPVLRDLGSYKPPPQRGVKAESFGRKLGAFYLKLFKRSK